MGQEMRRNVAKGKVKASSAIDGDDPEAAWGVKTQRQVHNKREEAESESRQETTVRTFSLSSSSSSIPPCPSSAYRYDEVRSPMP